MPKTVTIEDSTRSSVNTITIERHETDGIQAVVSYAMYDGTGAVVFPGRSVRLVLDGTVKAALMTFIDNTVLPAIDAAEGMI